MCTEYGNYLLCACKVACDASERLVDIVTMGATSGCVLKATRSIWE